MRVPILLADSGLVVIDATWGTIKPMRIADGVRTVGELEVMEHLDRGLVLIDSRPAEAYGSSTIPGARNIPHDETVERISQLDPAEPTIFFCNGPSARHRQRPSARCSSPSTRLPRFATTAADCTTG